MNKRPKKNGDKPGEGKNQQIDSFFSRRIDKKESADRAILDNITNNMEVSPEKTEQTLVKSPIISKSKKIENDVIEGTPNYTVSKIKLKRKRNEVRAKQGLSRFISFQVISFSLTSKYLIFKASRQLMVSS